MAAISPRPPERVRAGNGEANAKACGLIAVDGVFHCLMRNRNPPGRPIGTGSSLMTSSDHRSQH